MPKTFSITTSFGFRIFRALMLLKKTCDDVPQLLWSKATGRGLSTDKSLQGNPNIQTSVSKDNVWVADLYSNGASVSLTTPRAETQS